MIWRTIKQQVARLKFTWDKLNVLDGEKARKLSDQACRRLAWSTATKTFFGRRVTSEFRMNSGEEDEGAYNDIAMHVIYACVTRVLRACVTYVRALHTRATRVHDSKHAGRVTPLVSN